MKRFEMESDGVTLSVSLDEDGIKLVVSDRESVLLSKRAAWMLSAALNTLVEGNDEDED